MVKTLKIESFKSIESVELELGTVNVFIGANGSGKSNLLEAFALLAAAAFGRVDPESLVRRGCRPSAFYRPLFRESPSDADTTASAIGEGTSFCVSLASPALGRSAAWEFRREVRRQHPGSCRGFTVRSAVPPCISVDGSASESGFALGRGK